MGKVGFNLDIKLTAIASSYMPNLKTNIAIPKENDQEMLFRGSEVLMMLSHTRFSSLYFKDKM